MLFKTGLNASSAVLKVGQSKAYENGDGTKYALNGTKSHLE